MTDLDKVKVEARESVCKCFTDEELQYYLDKNEGNVNNTIYEILILKSEDSSISVSGLNTTDTSSYFKRLASRFKPSNSGILKGV